MAVPVNNAAYLRNTTGGAFLHARQGGTILNNNSTTSYNRPSDLGDGIITKALELDDAADNNKLGTFDSGPLALADGLQGNQAIAGSNFAYNASSPTLSAPTWVLSRVSTTLAGVANTRLLFMGRSVLEADSIAQFRHLFGAQTVTAFRAGRFTLTGTFADGTSDLSRVGWLNAARNAVGLPTTMSDINTWATLGWTNEARTGTGAAVALSDSAANPTRAIPGRLVVKNDFVTLGAYNGGNPGGDFLQYAAITGM